MMDSREFHRHREHPAGSRRGRRHWSDEDGLEGRRGDRGRSRGRRRMFDNGELRLILLHLINEEPRHGYDLIRAVEALTRGAYAPSPGVIYPTLTLLRDMGFVGEPDTDDKRKLFSITPEGQSHLAENAEVVAGLLQRLGAAATVRERTDAAPVRRAMHNLKSVLIDKLSPGAERETVLAIVALIDDAAQKIERL